ncbi:hypothetical protein BDF19DRAFT_435876 [Syncephalis fuscata]|nr:hypothetical protein BDF19DRAFT_435876 [Syncephalis fuscata]
MSSVESGERSRGLLLRRRSSLSTYTTLLVVGMLFTGTCNTILNKVQDMQCVENCDDPDHSKRKYFEQPIYQTLNMFVGELICLFVVYFSMAATGFRAWRSVRVLTSSSEKASTSIIDRLRRNSNSSSSSSSDDEGASGSQKKHRKPSDFLKKAKEEWEEGREKIKESAKKAKDKLTNKGKEIEGRLKVKHDAIDTLSDTISESIRIEVENTMAGLKPMNNFARFLFWIPTMCDICGTTLMNVGLIYTTASIYQMLRGAVVIFSAILSVIFLRHRIALFQWFGLMTVMLGVSVVGLSGLIGATSDPKPTDNASDTESEIEEFARAALGIFMVLFAQMFTAIQFVVEEKILKHYAVEPLMAVGLEGFWGCITIITAMPLLYFTLGILNPGGFFDIYAGWHQFWDNEMVWKIGIAFALSISLFNWFGLSVTRHLSSVSRATIDTCR